MPTEYHFEKSWFELYLFSGAILALWVVCVVQWRGVSRPTRESQEDNNGISERTDADIRGMRWLSGVAIGTGALATLVLFFGLGAPYLTRFDTEGVTYLSATGWKREMWKDASKVALISGMKQSVVRVYLPYYALDFGTGMFVHPEQVTRTLQAEVVRHKKSAST